MSSLCRTVKFISRNSEMNVELQKKNQNPKIHYYLSGRVGEVREKLCRDSRDSVFESLRILMKLISKRL